jgi:hypothetical protein
MAQTRRTNAADATRQGHMQGHESRAELKCHRGPLSMDLHMLDEQRKQHDARILTGFKPNVLKMI